MGYNKQRLDTMARVLTEKILEREGGERNLLINFYQAQTFRDLKVIFDLYEALNSNNTMYVNPNMQGQTKLLQDMKILIARKAIAEKIGKGISILLQLALIGGIAYGAYLYGKPDMPNTKIPPATSQVDETSRIEQCQAEKTKEYDSIQKEGTTVSTAVYIKAWADCEKNKK